VTSAASLPVVIAVTWAAARVREQMPESLVRRSTAYVLACAGGFLLAEPWI